MITQTSRFNPREGEGYGSCVDCNVAFATDSEARAHRAETRVPGGRSHTTHATNPTRQSRIQSHVDFAIEVAISNVLDELKTEINDGVMTEAEVSAALRWHHQFADAWVEN